MAKPTQPPLDRLPTVPIRPYGRGMVSVLIDITLALVTGIGLWAVLPRGVVLTRSVKEVDRRGKDVFDTWQLRNESALSIRLTSVAVQGIQTMDEATGRFRWVKLTPSNERDLGVELSFDDGQLETSRIESDKPWGQTLVPPGDVLLAHVTGNTTLRVRYRRAGWTGVFERREVVVAGHV